MSKIIDLLTHHFLTLILTKIFSIFRIFSPGLKCKWPDHQNRNSRYLTFAFTLCTWEWVFACLFDDDILFVMLLKSLQFCFSELCFILQNQSINSLFPSHLCTCLYLYPKQYKIIKIILKCTQPIAQRFMRDDLKHVYVVH